MALDYKATAAEIVRLAGGEGNIESVSHCMTRLRFVVRDRSKADMESIGKVEGVLGCVYAAEQLQVILGQNLIGTYNEVVGQFHFREDEASDENLDPDLSIEGLTWKTAGTRLLGYISASVTPMIPGLIAGGMLKVVLLLLTLAIPGFSKDSTYTLLSIAADAPFYFMPVWVAYGAAKKMRATPIYAMAVAAAMFAPSFLSLVNADPQVPQTLLGMNVLLKSYASSLLPALLLGYAAARFERLWDRVVPGIFKSILVGLLTMTCTYILTMLVFAPLGTWLGDGFVAVLMGVYSVAGPLALALLAGCMPFLIMVGVHTVFSAFMVQMLSNPGYDPLFRPALLLHNMAEGGAALGVFFRAKDKEFKSEALSIAVGCILAGVSEPAIYGIDLRFKRPFYAVCAGGAAGGLVGGLMGMHSYIMGYSNVFALPIFQDTVVAAVAAIVTAIVVSCGVSAVLGFDESIVTGKGA